MEEERASVMFNCSGQELRPAAALCVERMAGVDVKGTLRIALRTSQLADTCPSRVAAGRAVSTPKQMSSLTFCGRFSRASVRGRADAVHFVGEPGQAKNRRFSGSRSFLRNSNGAPGFDDALPQLQVRWIVARRAGTKEADGGRERRSWADSAQTGVASRRSGVRAKAATPLRAQNGNSNALDVPGPETFASSSRPWSRPSAAPGQRRRGPRPGIRPQPGRRARRRASPEPFPL